MNPAIDIQGFTGVPMRAVLNTEGDKPIVEFYDRRYKHTPDGQKIAEYHLDTLMESDRNTGLNLQGHVPEWRIDNRTKGMIQDWAAYHTYTKPE
jgi:hypothetical protein